MNSEADIIEMAKRIKAGEIDIFSAFAALAKDEEIGDLGFARIDHSRQHRCGFPEFIYGEGKSLEQLRQIIPEVSRHGSHVLVTRIKPDAGEILAREIPAAEYDPLARTFILRNQSIKSTTNGLILIVSAGTSDLKVALEAKHTAELCDCGAELLSDVGVAGIHRLFAEADRLRRADAIIVVAGMEGALPSVIGGVVKCPVIAVPTSIGYGAALNGFTALFGMLNSCSAGVTVVNIDNGFGAACAAVRIINSKR
jgi:NCAIR mutase (PurE)-related protein